MRRLAIKNNLVCKMHKDFLIEFKIKQITHRDLSLSAVKSEKFEKSHLGLEPTKCDAVFGMWQMEAFSM